MQRWISISLGGLLLWASASWAVSKVGGGILSNDVVGFLSSVPPAYNRFLISPDQDVRMDGPPLISNGALQMRFMVVHLLENEQPQWVGKTDRQEFHDYFLNYGWTQVSHTDPCIEQFEKDNGNAITRVLSWGDGRGVVFTSTSANAPDVTALGDNLKLSPGVCSWK